MERGEGDCRNIHTWIKKWGATSKMGKNPFEKFCVDTKINYIAEHNSPADANEINLSKVCRDHYPLGNDSKDVYDYISSHIEDWVEEAINIRNKYPK